MDFKYIIKCSEAATINTNSVYGIEQNLLDLWWKLKLLFLASTKFKLALWIADSRSLYNRFYYDLKYN